MIYEVIVIKKPIFSTYCGIRDKYINHAIGLGRWLKIKLPDGIVGIHNPKQWKATGKKIEKVFLIPDKPMILYANYVKSMTKEQIAEFEAIEFSRNL